MPRPPGADALFMQLKALQAVATLAGRSFAAFPDAARAVLGQLEGYAAGGSVFVALWDEPHEQWVVVDAAGELATGPEPGATLDPDGPFAAEMAGDALDPAEPRARDGAGGSYAWVPLEGVDGERAGSICAVAPESRRFGDDDLELLGLMGRVLSTELRHRQHEQRLREQASNLAAVARAAREIADSGDARQAVCRAACEVSGSVFATLVEPDGPGHLRVTAADGIDLLGSFVPLDRRRVLTARVFATGEPAFVRDARDHPATVRELIRDAGIVSVHVEPVMRDGLPVGVLSVGWSRLARGLASPAVTAIQLLASEAAIAIERADTRVALERLARADALTGLPNRRAWDEHLARTLAAARRSREPLVVVRLELEGPVEDEVLAEAAAALAVQLREVDLIARWKGQAFAVALPGCDLEQAGPVVARLRAATPAGAACAAGAAQWQPGESPEALIDRAERALGAPREPSPAAPVSAR